MEVVSAAMGGGATAVAFSWLMCLCVKAGSGLGNRGQKQVGPTMEDCWVLTIRLWD
jgi:hypothetical protein